MARRQNALNAVAMNAADSFARAPLVASRPGDEFVSHDEYSEAMRRQQALAALEHSAQRGVSRALSVDEKEIRAWSTHGNKAKPHTTMISSPPPRHVPSDRDTRMGKPSDKAFAARAMGLPGPREPVDRGGAEMGMGNKPPPSRDALAVDTRTWRCTRCHTMQRPTATTCVSCSQPRAAPFSANHKLHVKPAGWTP